MPHSPRNATEAAHPAKDVVFIVFDGVEAIDIAGPASVFSKAEQWRPGSYRLHVASPAGQTVLTNSGLSLAGTLRLDQLPAQIDTLIVSGGDEPAIRTAIVEHGVSAWLAQVIGTHLEDDLSVQALAERSVMSPRHFARAFVAEAGCTPARFVEQARVAAAAQFLVQTQWTLERIAERSGFRSVDALQRAFRRGHGVTPRAYRERERQNAAAHFTGQHVLTRSARSGRRKPC